jgi:DNA-binding beta-propeller fold protein YncE
VQVAGLTPYQAAWSPDGRWIAVVENGERRIVILDAATLAVIVQPGPASGIEGIAW